jgi:hypothetical protein
MEGFKKFCSTCKEERDIVEIEKSPQGETIKLSCGHPDINIAVSDAVRMFEQVEEELWKQGRLVGKGKQRTKISGETKRLAKEILSFDWEKRKIFHKVHEQNQDGEWILVHDEEKPFPKKHK